MSDPGIPPPDVVVIHILAAIGAAAAVLGFVAGGILLLRWLFG